MGLDPMKNFFVERAVAAFGRPDIRVEGDDSEYDDWDNVPPGIEHLLNYGEEWYGLSNLLGFLFSEMDPVFPIKRNARLTLLVRNRVLLLY